MPPRHHGPTHRQRFIIFFAVLIFVPITTYFVIQLARGYRPDLENRTLRPTGLLVARSVPPNAEVYVNGEREGTTETTINLDPGTYEIKIGKSGFHNWSKTMSIEKELVTAVDALLFPSVLTPETVRTVSTSSATLSPDTSKLIFVSPLNPPSPSPTVNPSLTPPRISPSPAPATTGIFSLELSDSPLNRNRDPRQITPNTPAIKWESAAITWSPDSNQILVRIPRDARCTDFDKPRNPCAVLAAYLLDPNRTNTLTNIVSTHKTLLATWKEEQTTRDNIIITKIPKILAPTLLPVVKDIRLSPNNSKILYTATASATIPDQIIPPIPAANSQPQERTIRPGFMYIYDIEEDRNFLVGSAPQTSPTPSPKPTLGYQLPAISYQWFPSSRHLLIQDKNEIKIVEYDGTNLTLIYNPWELVKAVPSSSGHRLFIITDDNDPKTLSQLSVLNLRP